MKNNAVFDLLEEILFEYRATLHYATVVRDMLEEEYKKEPRPGVGNYGSFKVLCDLLEPTTEKIYRLGYLLEEYKPKAPEPEKALDSGALYGRRCVITGGQNNNPGKFAGFFPLPYSETNTTPPLAALVEVENGRVIWCPLHELRFVN